MSNFVLYNGRQFPLVNGEATRSPNGELPHQPAPSSKPRKYKNKHCIIGSEHFDSEKEGRRHLILLEMQKRGQIADLKRQVTFKLIVNGHKIGSVRPDWTYLEFSIGRGDDPGRPHRQLVAEDCKGYATPSWKTRWKLAKALHPEIEWRLS